MYVYGFSHITLGCIVCLYSICIALFASIFILRGKLWEMCGGNRVEGKALGTRMRGAEEESDGWVSGEVFFRC
jgi:hypothetical protein